MCIDKHIKNILFICMLTYLNNRSIVFSHLVLAAQSCETPTALPSGGVHSSVRYSVVASMGRIYTVNYFGCDYCANGDHFAD